MGAWGTDIFDNDNAADFKASVEHCSDIQARHDLLQATMGAILERDIRPDEMMRDYEFGYEVEFALASAAYVADAKNGRHQFTNTSYAMGYNREVEDPTKDEAWYHIDIGMPGPELVETAVRTVNKLVGAMHELNVDAEWITPSEELLLALME